MPRRWRGRNRRPLRRRCALAKVLSDPMSSVPQQAGQRWSPCLRQQTGRIRAERWPLSTQLRGPATPSARRCCRDLAPTRVRAVGGRAANVVSSLNRSSYQPSPEGLSRITRRPFVKDQPDPYNGALPPAGLEPATCALRRRLLHWLGDRLVPREFGCTICLVKHAARQGPPPTLGSGWDRKVSGRSPRSSANSIWPDDRTPR